MIDGVGDDEGVLGGVEGEVGVVAGVVVHGGRGPERMDCALGCRMGDGAVPLIDGAEESGRRIEGDGSVLRRTEEGVASGSGLVLLLRLMLELVMLVKGMLVVGDVGVAHEMCNALRRRALDLNADGPLSASSGLPSAHCQPVVQRLGNRRGSILQQPRGALRCLANPL